MKRVTLIFLALTVLALISLPPVMAQDMVAVAPGNCIVKVENDHVRVVEVTLKPGDTLPLHSHPAFVFYGLADCSLSVVHKDGPTDTMDIKTGDVVYSEPEAPHTTTNTGKTVAKVLLVELKDMPYKAPAPVPTPK